MNTNNNLPQTEVPDISFSEKPCITMPNSVKNMIAGGTAGSIGKTLTAPLSRLTVLYQVSSLLNTSNANEAAFLKVKSTDSLYSSINKIIKKEGFFALWKGNLTSVIHRFPYSAINFSTYEFTKATLLKRSDGVETPTIRFLCGSISGATACFCCYPLDLVRTRLTVSGSYTPPFIHTKSGISKYYSSLIPAGRIIKTFSKIIEREGFFGLYHGLSVALFVSVPSLALSFTVYGYMKEHLLNLGEIFKHHYINKNNEKETSLNPIGSLISGCVSGMISSIVMFPADVIRKRMQVLGDLQSENPSIHNENSPPNNGKIKKLMEKTVIDAKKHPQANAILHQCKEVIKHDGIRGFYRGIAPEMIKVCPMLAITFCTYELVFEYLNHKFPHPE